MFVAQELRDLGENTLPSLSLSFYFSIFLPAYTDPAALG
jgi:hypothetical protein